VIAEVRGATASRHPREDLVVVLVSAQMQKLRLLDGTEDNPLLCGKQERPVGVACGACLSAPSHNARGPADTRTNSHLANDESFGGTELQGFSGKIGARRERDHGRPGPG
jgi:hypothetical protein